MPEAKDLRIGNLLATVADESEILVVDGIDSVEGTVSANGIEDWYTAGLDPIPLTEDWLKKFGFQKHGSAFFKSGFEIILTDIQFKYDVHSNGMKFLIVEYVHELQNLYYALTGEELKINSEKTANIE